MENHTEIKYRCKIIPLYPTVPFNQLQVTISIHGNYYQFSKLKQYFFFSRSALVKVYSDIEVIIESPNNSVKVKF